MRVLIVSELFYPRMRGGEVVLWRIARALVARGHQVQVITSRLEDAVPHEVVAGVEIRRPLPLSSHGKSTSVLKAASKVVFMVKLSRYLDRLLANEPPDVIYNNAYTVTLPCGRAGRRHGVPVVTEVGNLQGSIHLNRSKTSLIGWMQFLKEGIVLRLGGHQAIRAATASVARRVRSMTRAHIYTIPNPIDDRAAREVLQSTDRSAVRAEYGVTERELMLLFVGALEPVKNLAQLIEALAHVSRPYKLLVVGSGSEESRLRDQVSDRGMEDRILFLGQHQAQRVLELMVASDVLILASKSENLPMVVLEALSVGTNVISTNVGGIGEIPSRNLNIVDTASEISHALGADLPTYEDWRVLEKYSTDTIASHFETMFTDVICQSQSSQVSDDGQS